MERDAPVGRKRRHPGILAVGALVVVLLLIAAFWSSNTVQTWAAGVLAAIAGGWLTAELQALVKARRDRRAGQDPPVVVTVESKSTEFVMVDDPEGPPRYVPASGHCLRLFVEATGTRTAILRGLHVLIVAADPPPAETSLITAAGRLDPRPFEVELDKPGAKVRALDGSTDFPFSVSPGDPEVLDLVAHTTTKDVHWRLVLAWTCEGRRGNTTVDFSGQPIRTMPIPDRP